MEDLNKLLDKRASRTARIEPIQSFYEKIRRSKSLLIHAESARSTYSIQIKAEARRQFVISLVTAFEVYIEDIVVELFNDDKVECRDNLVKTIQKKFSILEVANIFKNDISLGELISNHINFQNLDNTFNFLGSLFDKNFSEYLYGNKFHFINKQGKMTSIQVRKGSYKSLKKLIDDRHKFVHDISFNNTPSNKQILFYETLIKRTATCIDIMADPFRKLPAAANKITKK